ncbi:MAG: ParB/RepB/Spo0J family partition protein [bacterium]|nr:ParB/RepB/Spo0J family partition protein [bacterium]
MLGKGLESLIPPHQNPAAQQSGNQAQPQSAQQPFTQPQQPAIQPASQPQQKKQNHPDTIGSVFHIEVEKIKPNPQQPRRQFNEETLKDLASSIREFGILQPIVVSKIEKETPDGTDVEYQLIAGERRWLASKMLGLERIPAIIRNVDLERERLELAIIENIQREDLNPIERARAFSKLQDEFRLTQREIASKLGKSRESVANTVRLLDLPANIKEALENGSISESHGRLLLAIDDPGTQERIFRELLDKKMTTRDLKNKVRGIKPENEKEPAVETSPEIKMLQEKLSSELGAPVKIESHGEQGRITITFFSPEELRNIVGKFGNEE